MAARVSSPRYQGVEVDHPTIVEYGRNMAKAGKDKHEIARILGMPVEIAEKIKRSVDERRG